MQTGPQITSDDCCASRREEDKGQIRVCKALTSFSIGQLMGRPVQGLLLLLFPPVAAVVMVVMPLLRRHALQGVFVEVHGVRALRGQCGDGALHGTGVRDGLQGRWRDTERGERGRCTMLGCLVPGTGRVRQ